MRKTMILKKALLSVIVFLVVLVLGTGFIFRNELKSVSSIDKVDDYGFYTMEYAGDYGFDEFLQVGASNDKELIQFVIGRILKGIPIQISETTLSCTTFNAVLPQGDSILGRNFDMSYSPGILVHTKPAKGYQSISMVNLAFIGYSHDNLPDRLFNRINALAAPYAPLDGINEKGLAIAVLLLPDKPTQQETGKIDLTTTTAIRLVLDKAATTDEAVALLKKYDMHDSTGACFHYQIVDTAGKSVVVEYVNNEMHVLQPEGTYQACTNFYLSPGEKYNFGEGQNRYKIAVAGLKLHNGIMTVKEGMTLLKAAKIVDSLDPKTGITYNTQWSAIYNNKQKSVDLCIGQNYDQVYHYSVAD